MSSGGAQGYMLQFLTTTDMYTACATVKPIIRPVKLAGGHKDLFRAALNLTMAAPNGEVITNVIVIKSLESTNYVNCQGIALVKFCQGKGAVKAGVVRCSKALFGKITASACWKGQQVPQRMRGYVFPTPGNEDGIRRRAEGVLPENGNPQCKRKTVRDDLLLSIPVPVRVLKGGMGHLERTSSSVSKML